MAKNPKDFMATPWTHSGKVAKSGPDKPLVHNGTRPDTVMPTPMSHFKKVPLSGDGHPGLGNSANSNIGNPYAMSSDRSELPVSGPEMQPATMKSKTMVPREVKKWHKKGYSMEAPADLASSQKIVNKMKAK
jgi:hypothetical protein